MLDLANAKRVVVVGGGTAGWFAALEMRHAFGPQVEVTLIESEQIGIIGAGEGSIPNFNLALQRYGIDRERFMAATQSTVKLGVRFDGWRTGAADDRYHHLFSTVRGDTSLLDWAEQGFYPLSSWLMSEGLPLERYPAVQALVERGASQQEVLAWLDMHPREAYAYHFDARALARFLRGEAEARGVKRIEGRVKQVVMDAGRVTALESDAGRLEADFWVDASGLARVIAGKALGVPWESFAQNLLLDAALPFMLPHRDAHPPLLTMSHAMKSGWMWVIPTQGRLGCGYVYSTAHIDEAGVLAELRAHWGCEIEPVNRLRFGAGRLARCLESNVLAVGLAAGFVEPLEATSIAHTLYQLSFFGNLVQDTHHVVAESSIAQFNREVSNAWDGILDFLLMHYDTVRSDTAFWRDAAAAAQTPRYRDLKRAFATRTPRLADLVPYQMGGTIMFGIPSWETVGFAMGAIPRDAAARQLRGLSAGAQLRLHAAAESLRAA
ncbi:tryptophan halogenase family protein [Ramlibacter albus]|uniref:Tryptophan 7-halogenase n=1 Tax=Ramlibacter albus TaxID=2079448 RepID=A0A923S3R3_9BURK|nr:tryptophan halogenase family protein [Ramlibacter albus]MBC5763372.1 tryptophan 7-halogenase [Ramlibacter albus]